MKEIVLNVKGMMCEGCENRVKKALTVIDGVEQVTANHNTGKVVVTLSKEISVDTISETIDDIGYEVIKED